LSTTNSGGTEQFEQAISLVAAGLHDRANELLVQCVRQQPTSAEFVEAFLNNLKLRTDLPKAVVENLAALDANLARVYQAKVWAEVVPLALDRLGVPPPHTSAFLALADAAAAERHPDVEQLYLAAAYEADPNSIEVLCRRATCAARLDRFEEAIALWERVEELDPHDNDSARIVARLTIDRSRCQAGLETKTCETPVVVAGTAVSKSGNQPPPDSAKSTEWQLPCELPHLTAAIKRTPIQQLEVAVREYPTNGELYLQLASLYLAKGREYDAERLLIKGREEAPDDVRVRHLWEDVSMLRMNSRVTAAQQQMETDNGPAPRAALADVRSKRDRQELEVYQQRCKREPENAKLQHQLGLRLKRAGKLEEAIRRFEAAITDPAERPAAAFAMGECLHQAGRLAEALRAYRQSADAANGPTQAEWRKRALYQAAELAGRAKLIRRARRYVGDLLRYDPHDHRAATLLADLERLKT
jgi:tetratricopeptide (TPR) repeat protein